jgi:hypothetical protein
MLITRFIEWLEKRANLKTVVILVMAIIPFNLLFFPWINSRLEEISGYRLLDGLFWYPPVEVFRRINAYQESGRALYLVSIWTADLLYPLIYALLFACILTIVLRSAFTADSPLQRMQLLPFMILLFDYLENISISFMLVLYPSQPIFLASLASAFTSLKWCFAVFSLIALVTGLVSMLAGVFKTTRT